MKLSRSLKKNLEIHILIGEKRKKITHNYHYEKLD
jgi:hypothetical protein